MEYGYLLFSAATVAADIAASCHVILYKRESRAAIAWVGFIWMVPVVGALLYVLFGINRLRRRAQALRRRRPSFTYLTDEGAVPPATLEQTLGHDGAHLRTLGRLVGDVTRRPLLAGNRVQPLSDGDQAYAAMLSAIDEAQRSVALGTYIFDNDAAGRLFLDALARAVGRGVAVRVLIDDVGARYRWPSIVRELRRAGIPFVRFLRRWVPGSIRYANMRNHRKILVVDGRVGFTGGMNIREGTAARFASAHPVRDLHFRIDGPAVAQLQEVFAHDWAFCTGEALDEEAWFPDLEPAGAVLARGIPDGPDDDFDKLRMTLLGAIACAQSSLRIITPYFLPDAALIMALNVAALRGVEVDILLPERGNLRLVQWASTAQLWQVLEHGCRVWLTPPPFDHTKLMLVDGAWVLLGSANWDPRSLRLNFEFNVECYDRRLAGELESLLDDRRAQSRQVTLETVDSRPLPLRLRDGAARLLAPYL